jgi:hypothetical protein
VEGGGEDDADAHQRNSRSIALTILQRTSLVERYPPVTNPWKRRSLVRISGGRFRRLGDYGSS